MIISRLTGGVGNQLFQYAIGRRQASLHNTELYLDLAEFEANPDELEHVPREYELGHFNVKAKIASKELVAEFLWRARSNALRQRVRRLISPRYYYNEELTPAVLAMKAPAYLEGYWQSEDYFLDARGALLDEIKPASTLDDRNLTLLSDMGRANAVAVHVRRGDYVDNASAAKRHGTCSIGYYNEALARIRRSVINPVFYVFSDDMDYARKHIDLPIETSWIQHNSGRESYKDLVLMSNCRHFVIANSSFSWWGAWLSHYSGKIVIAPKQWFRDPGKQAGSSRLVPEGWIRI